MRHTHDRIHDRIDRRRSRRRRFAVTPEEKLAKLERYQRDLEQELADVVSRIERLRQEAETATTTDA
jgi:predicted  nucleic acid-binding Zn-ribbon protein